MIEEETAEPPNGVKGGPTSCDKGSQIDKVISLEQELKMLQDDNMNPRDIYLQHCLNFARSNFDQLKLTIEDYQIKSKDVDDKIFFKESDHNFDQEGLDMADQDFDEPSMG